MALFVLGRSLSCLAWPARWQAFMTCRPTIRLFILIFRPQTSGWQLWWAGLEERTNICTSHC